MSLKYILTEQTACLGSMPRGGARERPYKTGRVLVRPGAFFPCYALVGYRGTVLQGWTVQTFAITRDGQEAEEDAAIN